MQNSRGTRENISHASCGTTCTSLALVVWLSRGEGRSATPPPHSTGTPAAAPGIACTQSTMLYRTVQCAKALGLDKPEIVSVLLNGPVYCLPADPNLVI